MSWKRHFSYVLIYLEGLLKYLGVKCQDAEPLFETSAKRKIAEAKW